MVTRVSAITGVDYVGTNQVMIFPRGDCDLDSSIVRETSCRVMVLNRAGPRLSQIRPSVPSINRLISSLKFDFILCSNNQLLK